VSTKHKSLIQNSTKHEDPKTLQTRNVFTEALAAEVGECCPDQSAFSLPNSDCILEHAGFVNFELMKPMDNYDMHDVLTQTSDDCFLTLNSTMHEDRKTMQNWSVFADALAAEVGECSPSQSAFSLPNSNCFLEHEVADYFNPELMQPMDDFDLHDSDDDPIGWCLGPPPSTLMPRYRRRACSAESSDARAYVNAVQATAATNAGIPNYQT